MTSQNIRSSRLQGLAQSKTQKSRRGLGTDDAGDITHLDSAGPASRGDTKRTFPMDKGGKGKNHMQSPVDMPRTCYHLFARCRQIEQKPMKRIIGGVTYNTDTSTRVATSRVTDQRTDKRVTLYQTKGGAFFAHVNIFTELEDTYDETHQFVPMTRDEAEAWVYQGETELLCDELFSEPPEAAVDEIPSTTVYLRIPSILKKRIEAAAEAGNQSLNAWAIRCLERCAGHVPVSVAGLAPTVVPITRKRED
jgi:predicted HicB family RNase H-like nuclease